MSRCLGVPGVTDRTDADRLADHGKRGRGRSARGVELGIERGEAFAVRALRDGAQAAHRAPLEAAQALERVLRPADRLAELAVARHVDAGVVRLPLDDFLYGQRQPLSINLFVVRLPGLLRPNERKQRLRPDQAADVRGEDALGAFSQRGF